MKLFVILILASQISLAGGFIIGDGGHFVICHDKVQKNKITQFEMLDIYEARVITGESPFFNFDMMLKRQDYLAEVMRRARNVLGETHPFLQILNSSVRLDQDFILNQSDILLTNYINNSVDIEIPSNCRIDLVAAAYTLNGQRLVLVDPQYLDLMSEFDHFTLMLHESLHDWYGPQNSSLAVRQTLWYLTASDRFREQNKGLFQELVKTKRPQNFSAVLSPMPL